MRHRIYPMSQISKKAVNFFGTCACETVRSKGRSVTIRSARTEDYAAEADAAKTAHILPRLAPVPRRRNQMLAVALVSLITGLFVIVVGLVIGFHYAETHHLLATL